jgi:hypothetical protein
MVDLLGMALDWRSSLMGLWVGFVELMGREGEIWAEEIDVLLLAVGVRRALVRLGLAWAHLSWVRRGRALVRHVLMPAWRRFLGTWLENPVEICHRALEC